MDIEIITDTLILTLHGFGSTAFNKDYTGTAFKLSGRMWDTVTSQKLKNKGKNIWVYENDDKVFAGLELESDQPASAYLEEKKIVLNRYARFRHVGPYSLIKQSGQMMRKQLSENGFETELPYIEIYGHWTNDESKLETSLLMALR